MLIVNLTTTSERLTLCSATVWSLMHQKRVPDKIILWVSKDAYLADKGIKALPVWIGEINSIIDIVDVKYVTNSGPYRKIIPALRSAVDSDLLVYADDDVIYGELWLQQLENEFKRNNCNYVIASRVRIVKKNIFGFNQSYNMFPLYMGNNPLKENFIITGVGGCILMKKHINDKYIFCDEFINIAPKADDLWISKIIELSHSEVKICLPALENIQEISHSINCLSHGNTVYFKGSGAGKIYYKIKDFILGYFGLVSSNNDLTMKRVNKFFMENWTE